jgi:sulfur-oxidizing protein SoxZ
MAGQIKIKTKLAGDVADVKCLMMHPMETGARKDPDTGELVPAHYITQLTSTNNGTVVMLANFSTAVSKDPYFAFKFSGASAGDTLKIGWVDNLGNTDEIETTL